jgi:oligo-1,6-glucosidase
MPQPTTPSTPTTPWWKDAVVYQIYPRSFADSNGDGIGDIPGIIDKLDHLAELGIDTVWLSPHFDSPNADNGYDIRNYREVMREFGTMADFDRMLEGMTARGIRLVVDLVVNHSSNEHAWFVESRGSRDNPKRDWYIWRDNVDGGPPNNYTSLFSGSAWQWDDASGQYYLHYFAVEQPDLNWEVPDVRAEVYDLMRFWLDKGVVGFRMDVIPFISKHPGLPDLTPDERRNPGRVYATGPRLHEFLQEMGREVLAPYDAVAIGEAAGVTPEAAHLFTDSRRGELSMIFHFDLVNLDQRGFRKVPYTLPHLKAVYRTIDDATGTHGWATSFLGNHDQPRAVSHFGDDSPEWRVPSAKVLATMNLTMRSTPFIYQGDEFGMTNYPFTRFEEYDDVAVKGLWRTLVDTGKVPAEELLAELRHTSRDHSRTPVQWTAEAHGGFTTGTPWLAVNPNYVDINAAADRADPNGVFHHHRRLIALRKTEPALVHGAFHDLLPDDPNVFAYTRTLDGAGFVVVLNFTSETHTVDLPGVALGECVLHSSGTRPPAAHASKVMLQGWEAAVHRITSTT